MINLLPDDEKKQLRAGRSNLLLLRYNIAFGVVVVFLIGALSFSYYYLMSTKTIYEQTVSENNAKEKDYAKVKADSTTFTAQLSEAKKLFDSQISYSKAVLNIAKLIPEGVVLSNIKLDQTSFSTPFSLDAKVKGETEALALKDNFQKSPDFSNVSFGTITKGEGAYPYNIQLNISMKKEAAQ